MRRRRAAQGEAARTKPGSRRRPPPPGTGRGSRAARPSQAQPPRAPQPPAAPRARRPSRSGPRLPPAAPGSSRFPGAPTGSRRRVQPLPGERAPGGGTGSGSERGELGHGGSRVCLLVLRVSSPGSPLCRHSGSVAVPCWGFMEHFLLWKHCC